MPKGGATEGLVYRRGDGRVVGEYLDAEGRKRYMTSKTMTKAQMKAALRERLNERDTGVAADSEGLTVAAYLDRWLESIRDTVREGTYKPYEAIVRLHLKPALGKTKLDKLNALQLQKLYREKLKAGLSPRRVRYIHATVNKALKDAVRLRLLRQNVAEAAKPPRLVRREMDTLTREQAQVLLRTAKRTQPKLHALYALAITTGARQGELLALQRQDVDMDAGTIRIQRSVYNGRVSEPKTSSGRRTIRLSRPALDALEEHLDAHAGDPWVFATSAGTPISCHNLHNRSWKPLLKAAGLPHETKYHSLRHTAASLLLGDGVPVPVVSQLLGHADSSITLKVYAHLLPDQLGTAALAMNGLLGEEQEPPRPLHTPS